MFDRAVAGYYWALDVEEWSAAFEYRALIDDPAGSLIGDEVAPHQPRQAKRRRSHDRLHAAQQGDKQDSSNKHAPNRKHHALRYRANGPAHNSQCGVGHTRRPFCSGPADGTAEEAGLMAAAAPEEGVARAHMPIPGGFPPPELTLVARPPCTPVHLPRRRRVLPLPVFGAVQTR